MISRLLNPARTNMDSRTTTIEAKAASGTRLLDGFGRVHDYVRIAVNERCNLRCIYCMPAEGLPFREGGALLSRDELLRVIRILSRLGVTKVRFTGGEPPIRCRNGLGRQNPHRPICLQRHRDQS